MNTQSRMPFYSPFSVADKVTFGNSCPDNMTVTAEPCTDLARVTYHRPTASDTDEPVMVLPRENFPILLPTGVHVREFTALGVSGVKAECSFSITVLASYCSRKEGIIVLHFLVLFKFYSLFYT